MADLDKWVVDHPEEAGHWKRVRVAFEKSGNVS